MAKLVDLYEDEGLVIQRGTKIGTPMKPLTAQYTMARLRHHVVPLLGTRRAAELTEGDIEAFARAVAKGKTAKDEKTGPRKRVIVRGGEGAARKVVRDLSAVLAFAQRRRIYTYRGLYLAEVVERARARKDITRDLPWLFRPAGTLAAGGVITESEATAYCDSLMGHLILSGVSLPPEPRAAANQWFEEGRGDDIKALFDDGRALGDFRHQPRQRSEFTAAPGGSAPPRPERPKVKIEPTSFALQDPSTLPRRQWLYGTHLLRKEISATLAPGGVGKTSLGIAEAAALAAGKPFLGVAIKHPLRVWLWNGEEPQEELMRRLHAVCLHHRISVDDLEDRLFVDNGHELPLVLAEQTRDGTTIYEPVVGELITALQSRAIDVMVCDPFVSTHNVTENDNNAIQKAATAWKSVAVGADVAIGLAHHTRKLNGREATAEDSRGADALIAKARDARALNPMGDSEAKTLGVRPEDRFDYFWTGPGGKSNMSRRTGRKSWFQMVSVGLGNGGGLNEPEDSVGVVAAWSPPEYRSEALDPAALDALETAMRGKTWRAAAQKAGSADWVGVAVADAFGIDRAKPEWDREAKAILRRLIAEGIVGTAKIRHEDQRRDVAVAVFHRVAEPDPDEVDTDAAD